MDVEELFRTSREIRPAKAPEPIYLMDSRHNMVEVTGAARWSDDEICIWVKKATLPEQKINETVKTFVRGR